MNANVNTNALEPGPLRRDLLLQEALDRQLDTLVRQANRTAALLEKSKMEKSQLRNLLNVAVTSRSPEVVINFIRYQIARDKDKWSLEQKGFGHTVIGDLRGIVKELAGKVVEDVTARMPDAPQAETLPDIAYARLMQLYLGYLNRAFYYGKETGDFERLREGANA
ncbi:MAG: hypothetical protein HXY37_15450 [Chloroflexi bacterium]|nr:hypothetical protein [Chloroflexota bacterium]